MAKHCFIDESGTMGDQRIMTVAIVLLEGVRTAEKLHPRLARAVFPEPKMRGLKELERWYASQQLHFAEMDQAQKLAAGSVLAKTNTTAVVGYCRHSGADTSHDDRFNMYRELLKFTINAAFSSHTELIVSIAKQGGWESYGPGLVQELRDLPGQFIAGGNYRKGTFFLASPSKQGQQIADFYASASWNYLIAEGNNSMSAPFDRVKHQIIHFEELQIEKVLEKEK